MPKSSSTARLLVEQAVSQLKATSSALAALKKEMQTLAAQLPEYPVVMEMFGVGPTLGPQLMAEIGDVRRFHSKKALVAYAGIDAPPNDSPDAEAGTEGDDEGLENADSRVEKFHICVAGIIGCWLC